MDPIIDGIMKYFPKFYKVEVEEFVDVTHKYKNKQEIFFHRHQGVIKYIYEWINNNLMVMFQCAGYRKGYEEARFHISEFLASPDNIAKINTCLTNKREWCCFNFDCDEKKFVVGNGLYLIHMIIKYHEVNISIQPQHVKRIASVVRFYSSDELGFGDEDI